MVSAHTIGVLIAHDEALTREGLAALIARQSNMAVVGHVTNSSQVLEALKRGTTNVLLLDLQLEGVDTIGLIQTIHSGYPAIAILIFTNYGGSEDLYRAMRAGVRGYLVRGGHSDEEIIEAIRTVAAGRKYVPDDLAIRLAERMTGSTLSHRELQVLKLILKGNSNKEISDLLNITEATVKYHVTSILTKLGVSDRTQAATAALLRGIIHPQDI